MPGLSFLSPLFLVGAAAAAIPIALHLFFRRAEPVIDFAAMRYLRAAPVERASRRRLREWLLLALRCAALLLLAVAFARPYLAAPAAALAAPATIVLVDTSASLSAPGQFDAAKASAERIVRQAGPTESVGVIAFGQAVDVVAPLSTDRAAALEAISSLKPDAGANRYRSALGRAADEIGGRPGRIVVVTDLQESGWDGGDEGAMPAHVNVDVVDVPMAPRNVAVTALRVEGREAVATIQNSSQAAVSQEVTFALDGRRLGSVAVVAPVDGAVDARFPLGDRSGGALSASVDDRAGLQADNTRYAVIDAASVPSILLVTTSGRPADAWFLEQAIGVGEGAGAFQLHRVSGRQFTDLPADALDSIDAILLLGTRAIEHQGRERLAAYVRGGGGVLITTGPDVDPAVVREALNGVTQTTWRERGAVTLRLAADDPRHPVFRELGGTGALANVSFSRESQLIPAGSAIVLARYTDGSPALVEEHAGAGRVLFFGSDLNNRWNDLPVQPAFVPFLHETLRYLAAARGGRSEYVVGELPGKAGTAPGVVTVGTDRRHRVAVNVDVRESNPARMTPEAFGTAVARLHARAAQLASVAVREREDTHRLWQYGLLLMVVSLAAESLIGRRLG
jgi:hypothetical protein